MTKKVLFWQPAGIGDILYLQKSAKYFLDMGYEVIWPVIPQFLYVKDYIPNITFCDVNSQFHGIEYYGKSELIETDELLYVPLNAAHQFINTLPMKAKYPLFGKFGHNIDGSDWADYLNFNRNEEREETCRKILDVKVGEKFIFINDMFASPPNIYRREMTIESPLKKVFHKMEHITQFNLFDLYWVLENAEEIHTVETSMCYLIERINTSSKLFMYSRKILGRNQFPNFSYVDHIYNKDWNYIV